MTSLYDWSYWFCEAWLVPLLTPLLYFQEHIMPPFSNPAGDLARWMESDPGLNDIELFSSRGPTNNGAIKPDVVAHAGNIALRRTGGGTDHAGLGVVSLNGGFALGPAFKEDIGTSYAAPQVAHQAARLLAEVPDASPSLLRALIGAHARWPQACEALLNPGNNAEGRDKLLRLVGYGRVDDTALFRSLDDTVTLLAEERVGNDQHLLKEI